MYPKTASLDFSYEDIERARRYHRARYVAFGAGTGLSVAVLALLAWGPFGRWLWSLVNDLGWAGSAAAFAALVCVVVDSPCCRWRSGAVSSASVPGASRVRARPAGWATV